MHRSAWALVVPLLVGVTACAAPLPVGSGSAATTVAPIADAAGVSRVRLDHRRGTDAAPPVVVVPRGGTVELVVGSETAERILLSGLDQIRYVTAGGTVTVRFVAAVPGPVTVTLGGSGAVVGTLEIR